MSSTPRGHIEDRPRRSTPLSADKVVVPVNWRPRAYQRKLYNSIVGGEIKRAACVWHRRAGKDHAAINIIASCMFQRPGIYWHVLPTYAQGNKAIWNGMDNDGRKFIDYIPKEAVARSRNDEMRIEVFDELGGGQYQVIGGDNPDRIVGGNPVGVVFSEYSLMNPLGWDLVRPILNANGGWAIFIYTPRGHNHGWRMLQGARESEKWYTEVLDITQTRRHDGKPVVTEEDVEEEIHMGMPEELARQEYYCDFSAPLVGAYYGKEFAEIDRKGRCSSEVEWRKEFPVYTCWDLGIRDATAIWFYQIIGDKIFWIDYESGTGAGIAHWAKVIDRKPYVYKKHYAPHDVGKREMGTGTSIMATAASLGLRFERVPRTSSIDDDIQACRLALARSYFNSEDCSEGIEALRHYRKEFDLKSRVWSAKPVHDWTSHCFTGDTRVLTRYGTSAIMDLPEEGEVLTLCGWKAYRSPRVARRGAPLVEVAFDDGSTVRCTRDHLFLTESGWRSSVCLRRGTVIQSASTHSRSTLRGASTGYGRRSGILKTRRTCTAMSGRQLLGRFLRGVISTTETVICRTMCFGTWSVWTPASTCPQSGSAGARLAQSLRFHKRPATRPQSGTAARQDDCGTAGMLSGQRAGQSGSGWRSRASTAARATWRWFARVTRRNSAPRHVSLLRIASVVELPETADVWDITVPGVEHFSLANGAIVHNSADALRTGCVVMPQDLYAIKEVPRFPHERTVNELFSEHDRLVRAQSRQTGIKRL